MATTQQTHYGTGRRKTATARVYLKPGSGRITVNDRSLDEFFGRETGRMIVRQPLEAVKLLSRFDIAVKVDGGGTTPRPERSATASPARSSSSTRACASRCGMRAS